jgi:hypothetical protein
MAATANDLWGVAPAAEADQPVSDPYGILGLMAGAGAGDPQAMLAAMMAPEPAAPAALARGSRLARPGDVCPECSCALQVSGMEYECPSCQEVFEAADIQDVLPTSNPEEPGAASLRGRLRIVGPEAGWFQPDMDRTNPGESSEQQKKTTYAELLRFNKEYESRGGNPFPRDVLEDVAENYNIIQQDSVKRSMMKKGILAALVFHACISRGFTRTRAEAAEFAKLPNHGIARGDDFLRSIDEDKGLDIDMNEDRLRPHITTTFAHLDLSDESYEPLREAVAAIVKIADAGSIGFRSVMRSKVTATAAEVLRRKGMSITAMDVSAKCHIRIHTIRRFLDELADYHSHFEETYRAHGLDSSRVNA